MMIPSSIKQQTKNTSHHQIPQNKKKGKKVKRIWYCTLIERGALGILEKSKPQFKLLLTTISLSYYYAYTPTHKAAEIHHHNRKKKQLRSSPPSLVLQIRGQMQKEQDAQIRFTTKLEPFFFYHHHKTLELERLKCQNFYVETNKTNKN